MIAAKGVLAVELVVSEYSGEIQQKILEKMNMEYLSTGKFVNVSLQTNK